MFDPNLAQWSDVIIASSIMTGRIAILKAVAYVNCGLSADSK